jgi:uncharacterized protein (DUF58 family)
MATPSIWRRTLDALRGGMRQRITLLGAGFSLATAVVGAAAFLTANNLLFLVLATLLGTLMVAGFVSRLSLAGLQLDVELPPHPTALAPHLARIALKNDKAGMPSFSIHIGGTRDSVYSSRVYIPLIGPGKTINADLEVTFTRRGLHTENSFQLVSRFPLGLTRRTVELTLRREVVVYPSLHPHPSVAQLNRNLAGEIAAQQRGQGHDFYRIRPYESNESVRHVDWRATAHTSALQVREFAREQEPLVEIYLDTSTGAGDSAWFEKAVDGCAYLVWDLSRRGVEVRLCAGGFDRLIPHDANLYAALEWLALIARSSAEPNIPPPLRADSSRVMFLGAAQRSPWRGAHLVDLSRRARRRSSA